MSERVCVAMHMGAERRNVTRKVSVRTWKIFSFQWVIVKYFSSKWIQDLAGAVCVRLRLRCEAHVINEISSGITRSLLFFFLFISTSLMRQDENVGWQKVKYGISSAVMEACSRKKFCRAKVSLFHLDTWLMVLKHSWELCKRHSRIKELAKVFLAKDLRRSSSVVRRMQITWRFCWNLRRSLGATQMLLH